MTAQLRSLTIDEFRGYERVSGAAQRLSLLDLLFAFSIVVYPANAAVGWDLLGEARSEPYILINLLLLPIAAIHTGPADPAKALATERRPDTLSRPD